MNKISSGKHITHKQAQIVMPATEPALPLGLRYPYTVSSSQFVTYKINYNKDFCNMIVQLISLTCFLSTQILFECLMLHQTEDYIQAT